MDYQFTKNNLIEIDNIGFKVTWKLVLTGYIGYGYIQPLITKKDIFSYFTNKLDFITDVEEQDKIIKILTYDGEYSDDDVVFKRLLEEYSNDDGVDLVVQVRKWRVLLLKLLLESNESDSDEAKYEFYCFWAYEGRIQDSTALSPSQFDVVDNNSLMVLNFENIIELSRTWVDLEINNIVKAEAII